MSSRLSRRRPAGAASGTGRGFTLIELMVAMAIIALLVAIALPAFSAARRAAKRASSEAMISVLSTGLDQFHADSAFGGQYPASAMQTVLSPHNGATVQVGGASFLAWGLAGADLLGTPGFRDLNRNNGDQTANAIKYDVIGGCTDDMPALYAINPVNAASNPGKPAIPRSGPYVEPSKIRTPKLKGNGFEIPVGNHALLSSICFLDAFDQPILYYKANPTAVAMAAAGLRAPAVSNGSVEQYSVNPTYGSYAPAGVYNLLDNGGNYRGNPSPDGLAGGNITGSADNPGIDLGGGKNHFNQMTGEMLGQPAVQGVPVTDLTKNPMGSFVHHIGNPGVLSVPTAYNANTYILLSAGPDGVFGTLDDVANFPVGK